MPISEVIYDISKEKGILYRSIINSLFSVYMKKIKMTHEVYRFDKVKPNNLADYVKGKKNLFLIAKLANNFVLGGYSKFQLDSEEEENESFLFSINPEQ